MTRNKQVGKLFQLRTYLSNDYIIHFRFRVKRKINWSFYDVLLFTLILENKNLCRKIVRSVNQVSIWNPILYFIQIASTHIMTYKVTSLVWNSTEKIEKSNLKSHIFNNSQKSSKSKRVFYFINNLFVLFLVKHTIEHYIFFLQHFQI